MGNGSPTYFLPVSDAIERGQLTPACELSLSDLAADHPGELLVEQRADRVLVYVATGSYRLERFELHPDGEPGARESWSPARGWSGLN